MSVSAAPGPPRVRGRVKRGHPRQPARGDGAQRGEQPVAGRSVAQPLQGLQGRHVGLPLAVLLHALAISDQDAVGRRPQRVQEGLDDRGLADAGLALHEHHLALAGGRGLEDGPERCELGVAPHQGRGGPRVRNGRQCDRRRESLVTGRGRAHSGDEANPAAVDGLDDTRCSRIVLKRPPQLAERLCERIVRHHGVAPDGRVQLFLRHERAGAVGQITQQSPGLGPQFHGAVLMPQASRTLVQPVGRKLDHGAGRGGEPFWRNLRIPSGLPEWNPLMIPAGKTWRETRPTRGRQEASKRSGYAKRLPEITISFREDTTRQGPKQVTTRLGPT